MVRSVLIADDSSFMRNILKNILNKNGYVIVGEAKDGNDALFKYIELMPDIVTLDITMPNTNGLQALELIKTVNPNVIVVMCTAIGQKVFINEAIDLGANDYLIKPFDAEKVIETFEKLTGGAK